MAGEQRFKEFVDPFDRIVPRELRSPKAIHLIPTKAQSSVLADHLRVAPRIGELVFGAGRVMLAPIDLDHDPALIWEKHQVVHPLACEYLALGTKLSLGVGVVAEINLGDEWPGD